MKYDVTDHPLLSEDAADLTDDQLTEHNEMAEVLTGLQPEDVYVNDEFGNWGDDVLRFVVLQVNHQVANMETGFNQSSSTVGPLSDSFRSRSDGAAFTLHTVVADGLEALRASWLELHPESEPESEGMIGGYKVLRSLRNASTSA